MEAELNNQKEEIECPICLNTYLMEDMAKCSNGHYICHDCIISQIEVGIERQELKDRCPIEDCNCKYSVSELDKFLPKEDIEKFDEIEAYLAVTISNIPDLRKCFTCGYVGFCEDENCPMICPKCNDKTCKKCKKKYHANRTCQEADINPWRFVEVMMTESVIRICPKCNLQVIKNGGCNHMTCTRCKAEFCYLCGQDITGNAGSHFGEAPKCKQSMDDENLYFETQIKNAREEGIQKYEIPL